MTLHLAIDAADFPIGTRFFTCGDIHGCHDELMAELGKVAFDFERDQLLALGDLVDRGPKSVEVLDLLDQPWFRSVRGNHEEMTCLAAIGGREFVDHHVRNGGQWFAELGGEQRRAIAQRLQTLPLAITFTARSGQTYGLVHADLPYASWRTNIDALGNADVEHAVLWNRETFKRARRGERLGGIFGVDEVYFGHSPVEKPVSEANLHWIDTKCYRTGILTLVELT